VSPFRRIEASADLVGREHYVELELFRTLGTATSAIEAPRMMVALSTASRSHAFRARLLEELLPVSLGLAGVDVSSRPPGAEFAEVTRLLFGERDGDELCRALTRVVYPEMLESYRRHLVSCDDAADLPVSVQLRRVISDLEARLDDLSDLIELDEAPLEGTSAGIARALSSLAGPFGPMD
jgi:hypothetical protein